MRISRFLTKAVSVAPQHWIISCLRLWIRALRCAVREWPSRWVRRFSLRPGLVANPLWLRIIASEIFEFLLVLLYQYIELVSSFQYSQKSCFANTLANTLTRKLQESHFWRWHINIVLPTPSGERGVDWKRLKRLVWVGGSFSVHPHISSTSLSGRDQIFKLVSQKSGSVRISHFCLMWLTNLRYQGFC